MCQGLKSFITINSIEPVRFWYTGYPVRDWDKSMTPSPPGISSVFTFWAGGLNTGREAGTSRQSSQVFFPPMVME